MMPDSDPRDGFFYLPIRTMIDYYNACGSAQSVRSLGCPHENLHPLLSKMGLVKILIRLRYCASCSEFSLCAYARGTLSYVAAQMS